MATSLSPRHKETRKRAPVSFDSNLCTLGVFSPNKGLHRFPIDGVPLAFFRGIQRRTLRFPERLRGWNRTRPRPLKKKVRTPRPTCLTSVFEVLSFLSRRQLIESFLGAFFFLGRILCLSALSILRTHWLPSLLLSPARVIESALQ